MNIPLFTTEGDLTAVPHANDNIPAELVPLAQAIGKVDPSLPASWGGMDGHDASLTTTPHGLPANDNLPPVIAFTGQAGSGKSTATRYLVERHGYTLVKFAGPLKDMMRALGLEEGQIEGDRKEVPTSLLAGKTPRHAMQTLGTEWGRNCIGEDFWVGVWRQRANVIIANGGRVVTDDCRFPNEAQAIRRLGGDIYRIVGRGGIAGGHVSERGCGDEDLVIDNVGSLEELHDKVEKALVRYA